MTSPPENENWIWVIVQNSGAGAHYLGRHDEAHGVSFIPAFFGKDAAQQCLPRLAAEPHSACEVQAVRFGDLTRDAALNGFMIFMLNPDGSIAHKIPPSSLQDST
jgi:hypothetical protein